MEHRPIWILALLTVVGCTVGPRTPVAKKAVEDQEIRDIPVPCMFAFDKEKSSKYLSTFRSCELHYVGPGWMDACEVLFFYKTHMPMGDWSLVEVVGEGPDALIFHKGTETCTVLAECTGTRGVTRVVIEIRPDSS